MENLWKTAKSCGIESKKEGNPEFALADLGDTQEQISKIRNMVKTERERILARMETNIAVLHLDNKKPTEGLDTLVLVPVGT